MNFYVIIIMVGILLLITLILIVIDKLLGSSGERTITINEDIVIPADGDESVLSNLAKHNIFVPSACGGKATCGACKVRLYEGGGSLKPTEEPFISKEERAQNYRLACQVKVRENIKVKLPTSLLHIKEYKTLVTHIEDLTYDIKLIRLQLLDPDTIDFKPGQYVQLKVPGIEIERAYSIASNPKDKNIIELIVRMVPHGEATTFVHRALEVGDKVYITGPFGDFYLREETNREMICIAGGSGKAPIRSILMYLKDRGMKRKVKYFFGARTKKDLYYTEEFKKLQEEFPNFEYIPALSEPLPEDEWDGEVGLITDVVDRFTGDLSDAEAYLCGSPGMINACLKVLGKHNIKDENIFYDKF